MSYKCLPVTESLLQSEILITRKVIQTDKVEDLIIISKHFQNNRSRVKMGIPTNYLIVKFMLCQLFHEIYSDKIAKYQVYNSII